MLNKFLDSPRVANLVMSLLGVSLLLTAVGFGTFGVLHSATTTTLPSPVGQNCGAIDIDYAYFDGSTTIYSAVPANCLWDAFQRCQTATLKFKEDGLDAGWTHSIIVRRGDNGCSVSDSTRHYNDESVDYASSAWAGLRPLMDGVFTMYGCGDEGDLKISPLG